MKFKERNTDVLYEAQFVGQDEIIVRLLPPYQNHMEKLTVEEFIERFDESYV